MSDDNWYLDVNAIHSKQPVQFFEVMAHDCNKGLHRLLVGAESMELALKDMRRDYPQYKVKSIEHIKLDWEVLIYTEHDVQGTPTYSTALELKQEVL